MTEPHVLTNDEDGRLLAYVYPASPESIGTVLNAPTGDEYEFGDGRSEFLWLRLANGDLMLGVFPRGGTYEQVEVDAAIPSTLP